MYLHLFVYLFVFYLLNKFPSRASESWRCVLGPGATFTRGFSRKGAPESAAGVRKAPGLCQKSLAKKRTSLGTC